MSLNDILKPKKEKNPVKELAEKAKKDAEKKPEPKKSTGGTVYKAPIGPTKPTPKKATPPKSGLEKIQEAFEPKTVADFFEQYIPDLPGLDKNAKELARMSKDERANYLARQRAKRGDTKTQSQKRIETKGTWENAVHRMRKDLGITAGSDEDRILKSALWMAQSRKDEFTDQERVVVTDEDYARIKKQLSTAEGKAKVFEQATKYREQRAIAENAPSIAPATQAMREQYESNKALQESGVTRMKENVDQFAKEFSETPAAKFLGKVVGAGVMLSPVELLAPGSAKKAEEMATNLSGEIAATPGRIFQNFFTVITPGAVNPDTRAGALAQLILDVGMSAPVDIARGIAKGGKAILASELAQAAQKAGATIDEAADIARQAVKIPDSVLDDAVSKLPDEFKFEPKGDPNYPAGETPDLVKMADENLTGDPFARPDMGPEVSTVPKVQNITVYHGGPDIPDNILRRHAGGSRSSDMGGIFVTPNREYAELYVKPGGQLYQAEVNVSDMFDFNNPDHVKRLAESLVESGEYDSVEDVLVELSKHGDLEDWSVGSGYLDGIKDAGFKGAKLRERPGSVLSGDAGFTIQGEPVYSYAIFDDIPVTRASKGAGGSTKPPVQPEKPPVLMEGQGLTHAETANIRADLDIKQYVKTKRGLDEVITASNDIDGMNVARQVNEKVRPVTDAEQVALIKSYHAKATQIDDLVSQASKTDDINELARLDAEISQARDDMTAILDASDKAGSEWGRAGRARQLEIANSDDPEILRYRYFKATGKKSSPEFDELLKDHANLKEQVAKLEEKVAQQQADLANNVIKDPARAKARVNYTRKTSKTDYDQAVKVWQSNNAPTNKRRGGVPVITTEQWKALKTMARYHLDNGLEDAAEIINKILEVTGDAVDRLTVARAVKEAAVDESRVMNTGRKFGEEYMERGANALESPELRKARFAADRRLADIQNQLMKEERIAKEAQQSWGRRTLGMIGEAAGTIRSTMASGDLSGLRQGGLMLMAQPRKGGVAIKKMFKSLSQEQYDQIMWEITQSHRYNEAVSAKLALTDIAGVGPREEAFPSDLFKRIEIKEGDSLLKKTAKGAARLPHTLFVGWSERGYSGFLNWLRMSSFEKYVDILEDAGAKLTKDDLTAVADFVNMMTGRGGKNVSYNNDITNKFFFSARLMKSRLDFLTAKPLRELANPNVQKAVKVLVAKEYAKVAAYITTTMALASYAGLAEPDPRSSKFGKIKIGDRLVDPFGGLGGYVNYAAKMGSLFVNSVGEQLDNDAMKKLPVGKTWEGKYYRRDQFPFPDPLGTTARFFGNKAAPVPGAFLHGYIGEDYKGDDTTYSKEFGRLGVPIGAKNLYESYQDNRSPVDMFVDWFFEFFGQNVSIEKKK